MQAQQAKRIPKLKIKTMSFKPAQLDPFALSGAGAVAGATSLVLKSFQTIDGVNLAMSDFGSVGYITLEPGNGELEEQASFSGVTQNSNGTATLTGIKTVLFLSPYTETSGLAKTHAGSTPVVVSNTAGFYGQFGIKSNSEAVTGYWTVPDPLSATGIANKEYVDNLVNGGSVSTNALIEVGTAGETFSQGTPVYLKVADGLWYKALGTTAATVNTIQLGIAQGAGTANVTITGGVLRRGIDTHQSGGAAGFLGYISNTGTVSTSTGTVERVIGNFLSATSFDFDPAFYYVPTAIQKAAMAGSFGTPSSTNTFLTSNNEIASNIDQSQTTQNGSQAVGQADSTTKANKLAQSFIPAQVKTRGVELYKAADTGTFTGTITISLQVDNAGNPSGSNLASNTITNAAWLRIPVGAFQMPFSTEYPMTIGSIYWIVVSCSTSDTSNHPNLGINSAGGYASGTAKYDNTTDGWVTITGQDLYFKTLNGILSQIVGTDSSTGLVNNAVLPSYLVDIDTTSSSVSAGGSETTMYQKVLPANFFQTTTGLLVKVFGNVTTSGGSKTVDVKVKINGTILLTYTTVSATVTSAQFQVTAYIVNTSLSAQKIIWSVLYANSTALAADQQFTTGTADTSLPNNVVSVTFTPSGTATLTGTYSGAIVERLV